MEVRGREETWPNTRVRRATYHDRRSDRPIDKSTWFIKPSKSYTLWDASSHMGSFRKWSEYGPNLFRIYFKSVLQFGFTVSCKSRDNTSRRQHRERATLCRTLWAAQPTMLVIVHLFPRKRFIFVNVSVLLDEREHNISIKASILYFFSSSGANFWFAKSVPFLGTPIKIPVFLNICLFVCVFFCLSLCLSVCLLD